MITYVVCLSVDGKEKITIPAVQGESQGRSIRVSLYQKPGETLSLEKAAVNLYIQKPSGLLVMLAGEVEDSGKEALFTLTRESCSEAGYCRCFMQVVYEDQKDLRVNGLELFVLPCQLDEAVESSEEFTALERALAQVVLYETHVKDEENPHRTTAEQVGARPENWMPTADEVGARPVTWSPTPDEIGAVPNTRTINGRPLSANIILTPADVNAVSQAEKAQPGGLATLDGTGKLTYSQLPAFQSTIKVYRQNSGGETYNADFAVGASDSDMCAYVGLISPEGEAVNSLQLWEDRTTMTIPLAVSSGGTGANTAANARSNLGMGKLLWSGNWAVGAGPITVTGLSSYSVVLVYLSGSGYILTCTVSSQRVRGLSCTDNDASNDNLYIIGFEADRSGDTLSNGRAVGFSHIPGGNHTSAGTFGVSAIYGIC